MADRLLTPSKITAWLDCSHYLTLRHEVDEGLRDAAPHLFGEMAQMLLDKGLVHEGQVSERYQATGRLVYDVPERGSRESFAHWVDRVGPVLDEGHDVIAQMPFVHDGVRGVADFLERVEDESGTVTYEPVDAKLARSAAKPGHVLQLCFYAEAIAASIGRLPERVHVELGSGNRETVRVADVLAYWRRLRGRLAALVAQPPSQPTTPEPCAHCGFCEFEPVCEAQWRSADSLVHVAGISRADREVLESAEVTTIASLASLDHVIDDIDPERSRRLVGQAALQVRAREAADESGVPFALLDSPDDSEPAAHDGESVEATLTGFAALPEPDDGDVFVDFEGHPFWRADVGLFFLLGLIERVNGEWGYRAFWAHDQAAEARATAELVAYLTERRRQLPGMHAYHYNHTERSALQRLTSDYAVAELDLENLVATGALVDLYPIVTGAVQVGTESYGLKHVERLTAFERSHDIDRGAGAVLEYEHWMRDKDASRLERIATYNDDDVRATLAVRDWLVEHRPAGLPWRPAVLEPAVTDPNLDARIEALHAYGPGTHEHLMGDLLGYWRRERRVVAADCLRLSMADPDDQLASPGAIGGLSFQGLHDRHSLKTGKKLKWPAAVFTFPPQLIDADMGTGSKLIIALNEQQWAFFTLAALDREAGTLEISWNQAMIDQGVRPTSLVHYVNFHEGAKLVALCDLADQMLGGRADAVGHAILRADRPRFLPGRGPAKGVFTAGYAAICDWAPHLDRSFVAVQGPPGTGKTFTGAHVVKTLVEQGKRVGLTAMSHHAIDNLMQAVVERFAEDGVELRAVRKATRPLVDGVAYSDDNGTCATGNYDVVAGTSWLFASQAMRENPVDVLVVDEAGQLGLADALAAAVSATDVILLGDPQQLPQVAQAAHPNRSGVSALDHLIGEGTRTIPADRGVLLDVTWRMHPDVCSFISDVMYDARLTSHPSCAGQTTSAGTGLRWIRAEHTTRSTESPEEAALVAATIERLVGTGWTDQRGVTRPLTASDIIVVAPYNDQRRLIASTLAATPAAAGVQVGTVDKFQGREAAVVIFSMATSSAAFMPRNADFLFSKNRLNVAVSRARCLAVLICTDELLDTRAHDVDQMALISALCSFVERAAQHEPPGGP
ncbi:MAG: TM0106 family RecB-like putative nuclease [Jiangellales bacterium]